MIVGLGNPGQAYDGTRHNVGFAVLDRLARRQRLRFPTCGHEAEGYVRCDWERSGGTVVLIKPQTFMNRSGIAVQRILERLELATTSCLVVYDDADLELGRLRLRRDGSSGGHNGVQSIIDALQTSCFGRVRLGVRGVGREDLTLADYVLQRFKSDEMKRVDPLLGAAVDAVETAVDMGLELAMNRFNGFRAAATETDK